MKTFHFSVSTLLLSAFVALSSCSSLDEFNPPFPDPITIDETQFPDKLFRALVIENYDTDNDGKLSIDEQLAVTTLSVSNFDIESLEGIKHFPQLRYLYCSGNLLTSLDLSKNPKIEYVSCYDNQLTSLNIQGCSSLRELYCYNNQLAGEAMDALVEALPYNASYPVFRVRYVTYIPDGNELTQEQAELARQKGWAPKMNVGGSWTDYTWAEGLKVDSENFPDENFLQFLYTGASNYFRDGVLTDEEIATITSFSCVNAGITSLKGIEHLTALQELRCNGNSLTELDLSANVDITTIYAQNNRIKGASLDALIASLPKREMSFLYILDLKSESEENEVTSAQIEAAKEKGWHLHQYSVYDGGVTFGPIPTND